METKIREAASVLRTAEALLITAGAGMGVDSGLPDFRGQQGFWRAYPAIANLGLSFEQIANPASFEQDPTLAWAFYGHRLNLYRATEPHQGFRQLLDIASVKPFGYFVFTSNVDGQFQKAGFASERILECHGSIHHLQCLRCCTETIWEFDETVTVDEGSFRALEPLPRCPHCSGLARPNILMFGDSSWLEHRAQQQQQIFADWLGKLSASSTALAVIELGAGLAIPTVRYTSEGVADRLDGRLIRINPREHQVPSGQIGLPLSAAEALRWLREVYWGLRH